MPTISRRSFLSASSVLPFCVWFEQRAAAQAALIRPDAWSSQGQAMLKIYAAAVDKMMNGIAEGDPTSWLFQWYTHSVGFIGIETPAGKKAAELKRVYPSGGATHDLAKETWNTCQAHFRSVDQPFFLPWHRMYVYFFERIIRKVSGESSFVLPYWHYSTPDASRHGIMPAEFRQGTDPKLKALFRANRNRPALGPTRPDVNAGQPIDRFAPGDLDLTALKQGAYLPAPPLEGFNLAIDAHLHGNVHVLTGDPTNMGAVPWAARDPIFWLHHCNIDRLWASWNKSGGLNPTGTWLAQSFIFADENGQRVSVKVDDFKDLAALKYDYDRLESAPAVFRPFTGAMADINRQSSIAYGTTTPVALGRERVQTVLQPLATAVGKTFAAQASTMTARRVYLVIRGKQTNVPPGVPYSLYLNPPANVSDAASSRHYIGRVSFFDAAHQTREGSADSNDFMSFDITEIIRDLTERKLLTESPTLAIVPLGQPAANARPVLGGISIVQL